MREKKLVDTGYIEDLPRLSDYPFLHASRTPGKIAYVSGERRVSYRNFCDQIEECARDLHARGVRSGDRVALAGPPCPEFLVLYMAAGRMGAVFVGLNPRHTLAEHAAIISDCRPRLLFGCGIATNPTLPAVLDALQRKHECIQEFIVLSSGEGSILSHGKAGGCNECRDDELAKCVDAVKREDPLALVYTSGSTGKRKGALLTHGNFVSVYREAVRHWNVGEIRQINNYPIDHVGGLGDVAAYAIIGGGTQIFMERFDAAASLAVVQSERVTVWGQEVAMFQKIVAAAAFETVDLSSVQLLWWAGAAAPKALIARLDRVGARLSTCWGMSETCGPVTFSRPGAQLDELSGSVGLPSAACEIRIADSQGQVCAPCETGEIQVRGDCLMAGYLDGSDVSRTHLDADGWFRTGDLGQLLADGNLRLIGRSKEMIKSGGYNIYPREIENVLEEYPGVVMAVLVAVPDDVFQEVGCAFILTKDSHPLDVDGLELYAREKLANYKIPKRFVQKSELPLLENGKVDRDFLKNSAINMTPRNSE